MSNATKNAHDWYCEEHGIYGWRGESCRQCPNAPDEIESLRQQLAVANHAHEFMSQQYLDALKERNQLRKDVAKLQEALHCKLTWKPS